MQAMNNEMTFDKALHALEELREEFGYYLWFSSDVEVYEESGHILKTLSEEKRPPTEQELDILIDLFNSFAHAGASPSRAFEIAERARDALDYLHVMAGLTPPAR
jgi:hypothetical protein